jgi:trimethylamine:corrinoid methyltransferase-like protein
MLASADLRMILDDASGLLERVGIATDGEARTLLLEAGGQVDRGTGRLRLPRDLVAKAAASAPAVVRLFDTSGRLTHELGAGRQYFTPGSSAVAVLDRTRAAARPPLTADYVEYVQVVASLPQFAAQSTAFIPADVPAAISDSYRLFLSLLHGEKPVVTGAFSPGSLPVMRDLQVAIRGSASELAARPLAIYTCCPTSPLAWSADAAGALIDCARHAIPVEVVPMPLSGFIAPVRLAATLVQHTAEALSGVVIAQLARAGAPVLYGCAATIFDVRYGTTPLGAAEAMLLACGAAQIGRQLGLPTQAYIGLSDAKQLDVQAGLETAMGAAMAAAAPIDLVAGGGMLDFVNTFSTEKLVVDHEICAMAARLRAGIGPLTTSAIPAVEELLREGHLLIAADTRRGIREEFTLPGPAIDRASRQRWTDDGSSPANARAAEIVAALVRGSQPPRRAEHISRNLIERMQAEARAHGLQELPGVSCVT